MLRRVHRGAFAAPALSTALAGLDDGRNRSLLTDLVYGTLRHQILIDACLAERLPAPERLPEQVRTALRLAGYELLLRGTPAHAAVAEWVEVVKLANPRFSGLANAVLRRLEMPAELPWHLRFSLPEWLAVRLAELLGESAEPAAAGLLQPEPLWLSLFDPDAAELLRGEGCQTNPGPLEGVLAARCPLPLAKLQAYRQGAVQPQNPASRLPVLALEAGRGERVLDLASGNGIKSALLAASGAEVTAVEIDERKVERARQNLQRLGLRVEHVVADLRRGSDLEPAGKVLLDAPCSGTGTLRGNPEIKLRLTPEDVASLAALQSDLLDAAARLTAPGGTLVYAVCALTPQEGPEQIALFLERHGEFGPLPLELPLPTRSTDQGKVVLPIAGADGFFIARLGRRPA